MKREPVKTPCRCQDKQCARQRLTQLHLYAHTDKDVEILEMLDALLAMNAADPARVKAVAAVLDKVNRAAAAVNN